MVATTVFTVSITHAYPASCFCAHELLLNALSIRAFPARPYDGRGGSVLRLDTLPRPTRCGVARIRSRFLETSNFVHSAICLVDGGIGFRLGAGIGIGDGDPSKRLAPDYPWLFFFFPLRIEERVGFKSVAMRP